MDDRVLAFLDKHHSAIMTTLKSDGTPHVARVGVGLVEGKLQSSGTEGRIRTRHLRRDPRSTLCVLNDSDPYNWLGLETKVSILGGDEGPARNLALYVVLAGEPKDLDEYLEAMRKQGRLVYEFSIQKAYGQY